MASSLEPLQPQKLNASLLADLPPSLLLDLLKISGLLSESQDSSFGKNNGLEKSCRNVQGAGNGDSKRKWISTTLSLGKDLNTESGDTEETDNQDKKNEKDVDSVKTAYFDSVSYQSTSEAKMQRSSAGSWDSVLSESDITSIFEPLVKVCAMKSLAVLLTSNKLLETLSPDVYTENCSLSGENSEQTFDCMQTLLRSMVSYSVLPSPFRKVVTLMDLERAQSVLLKVVPATYAAINPEVEKKEFVKGTFS